MVDRVTCKGGEKICPECEGSGYGFGLLESGCTTCNAAGKVSASGGWCGEAQRKESTDAE